LPWASPSICVVLLVYNLPLPPWPHLCSLLGKKKPVYP
jgi:hypothetical protein